MRFLSQHGLHDVTNERWNVYGQFTYITNFKIPFHAPYTNANGAVNSFSPDYERSYTGTFPSSSGRRSGPAESSTSPPKSSRNGRCRSFAASAA